VADSVVGLRRTRAGDIGQAMSEPRESVAGSAVSLGLPTVRA
jgi:hypothetical protein